MIQFRGLTFDLDHDRTQPIGSQNIEQINELADCENLLEYLGTLQNLGLLNDSDKSARIIYADD